MQKIIESPPVVKRKLFEGCIMHLKMINLYLKEIHLKCKRFVTSCFETIVRQDLMIFANHQRILVQFLIQNLPCTSPDPLLWTLLFNSHTMSSMVLEVLSKKSLILCTAHQFCVNLNICPFKGHKWKTYIFLYLL